MIDFCFPSGSKSRPLATNIVGYYLGYSRPQSFSAPAKFNTFCTPIVSTYWNFSNNFKPTLAFHAGDAGSNPVGEATSKSSGILLGYFASFSPVERTPRKREDCRKT
jgi:hypothetical protein